MRTIKWTLGICAAMLVWGAGPVQAFKFSDDETKAQEERDAKLAKIADRLSVSCRQSFAGKKVMVVIAQRHSNGSISARQDKYGAHFQAINKRLRALGMQTYTQEQINAQIAQAQINAFFRNDPDAAIAASSRLGASYVLKGEITSHAAPNKVVAVNDVTVRMGFTLTGANGRTLSDATAQAESYAGSDVVGMALTLVEEQADDVVSQLYYDFCTRSGKRK